MTDAGRGAGKRAGKPAKKAAEKPAKKAPKRASAQAAKKAKGAAKGAKKAPPDATGRKRAAKAGAATVPVKVPVTIPVPPVKPPIGPPPKIPPPVLRAPPVVVRVPPVGVATITDPARDGGKLMIGPSSYVGGNLAQSALGRLGLDPKTTERIQAALGDLLPGRPVAPGTAANDRTLTPDALAELVPAAAIVAAGLDPAAVDPPAPDVVWRHGPQALVVKVSGVQASLADGLVELTVPVSCDQTGDTAVTVSFVTGTPDQPAGGLATTEDHPRGPAVVVENWAEALIAYAWHILVTATTAFSSAAGADPAGRDLVTAALEVTANGMTVTPMGRHVFSAATPAAAAPDRTAPVR